MKPRVFEGVLDLKRPAAPREGAMQKLGGVFERRCSRTRRTERQYMSTARKFLREDGRPCIRYPIERCVSG